MTSLHLIVREQFPEFVQDDYPVFVAFVKAYYAWLDQESPGKIEEILDLDKTPESFVKYFRYLLDSDGLFNDSTPFNKLYLQKIKQIYTAKGSEQALTTVLSLVHNADVSIKYPSQNILKASDGKWTQNSFISIKTVYGNLPSTVKEFFVKYDQLSVRVELLSYLNTGNITNRFYFSAKTGISISIGQQIYVYNEDGSVAFIGEVIKLPIGIDIIDGGKKWQLGQVIRFPGESLDTIARVAAVDTEGSITRIEILEYGYYHPENQTIIVSPYPNKPLGTTFDIVTTQTSASPPKFHYELTVSDYIDGATDRVIGSVSGTLAESYFLEDYVDSTYVSIILFDNVTTIENTQEIQTSISMEEWLESRATLRYTYGNQVTERGYWLDEAGSISNQTIKLQDDFYYQQFSYDIESTASISKYIDTAQVLHPAGMKMFMTELLQNEIVFETEANISFPFYGIDLLDVAYLGDSESKEIEKNKDDSSTVADSYKVTTSKKVSESLTSSDSSVNSVTKSVAESLTSSDSLYAKTITKNTSETSTISETYTKTFNKYTADTASISSPDTSTLEIVIYNEQSYFSENYVESIKLLTIGA